jgi:hypothetical protein
MSVRAMADVWMADFGGPLLYQGRAVYEVEIKAVLLALADAADDDGTLCFPSFDLLERKTGVSAEEIRFALNALRSSGVLWAFHDWQPGDVVEINLSALRRMS